jgi:hypothetical protein
MILILKRISPSTALLDIESFISPVLKGGLFSKSGNLEKISIRMLQADKSDKAEFNALIRVEPDSVAERVIKQLNRKLLNGRPICVAQYHLRMGYNERRSTSVNLAYDRRRTERRRQDLKITDITKQQNVTNSTKPAKSWEWGSDSTL